MTKVDTDLCASTIPEFFATILTQAVKDQNLDIMQETTVYLVNLLHNFTRAEELFGEESETLAALFLQSQQNVAAMERVQKLKRLGDVALYVSGFFSDSLNRKLVDVDYYISMGGSAYGTLTQIVGCSHRSSIFQELAENFDPLVDVLSHVSEQRALTNNEDLLRLYERWLRTGSDRLYKKLVGLGVLPAKQSLMSDN